MARRLHIRKSSMFFQKCHLGRLKNMSGIHTKIFSKVYGIMTRACYRNCSRDPFRSLKLYIPLKTCKDFFNKITTTSENLPWIAPKIASWIILEYNPGFFFSKNLSWIPSLKILNELLQKFLQIILQKFC